MNSQLTYRCHVAAPPAPSASSVFGAWLPGGGGAPQPVVAVAAPVPILIPAGFTALPAVAALSQLDGLFVKQKWDAMEGKY